MPPPAALLPYPTLLPVPMALFSNSCTPPSMFRVPLLKMAPPSADVPEPATKPPCNSIFFRTNEPPEPGAISKKRIGDPLPTSMMLPLPLMVRVEATVLPMTGNPLGPFVLLFTAVNEYGPLPVRLMVLAAAPFVLAEWMSAMSAAVVAALKAERQTRFSKASTYRRRFILRRRAAGLTFRG